MLTTNANGTASNLQVDTEQFQMVDGVRVRYFNSISNDNTFVSFRLWSYLYRHCREYDIIHIHTWWNFLVLGATFICRIKKAKVVLSPRGMLSHYIFNSTNSKIKKSLHRLIGESLLKTTTFNATSEQEYLECKSLIEGWDGFVLPNIIELPEMEIVKKVNTVFTLSFLSRIDPKKGLEFVFEAMSLVGFPVKLRIAGKGEEDYIAQLKTLAQDHGISDSIEWVGWMGQEDKFKEMMNSDLFVLESHNENFANVVIEALYVGTPVLISEHVGLASYILANDLGWVTSLEPNEIAEAIKSAYAERAKRSFINNHAHQLIIDSFSPKILAEQYIDKYQNVIYEK